jgi:nicotinate-nucleotide adenylyltransferase
VNHRSERQPISGLVPLIAPTHPARLMNLALYGGTFDPLHHGHLILAREALEQLGLDRVIFIPAAISPHKLAGTPAPPALRREMVAAAIADEPRFELDDSELHRAGPSFTIDTVEQMRARYPGARLFYFIGADNLKELHTWRRIDDLRRLVQFVVFGRGDSAEQKAHDFSVIARRIDISATDIRARVARGASIRYLVPERVRAIIENHHLYQESRH